MARSRPVGLGWLLLGMRVDQPFQRRRGAFRMFGDALDRGALDLLLVSLHPDVLLLAGIGGAAVHARGRRAACAGDRGIVRDVAFRGLGCHGGSPVQAFTTSPPFGCRTCPLMYDASSLARNT